jgi:hypothetical protein
MSAVGRELVWERLLSSHPLVSLEYLGMTILTGHHRGQLANIAPIAK